MSSNRAVWPRASFVTLLVVVGVGAGACDASTGLTPCNIARESCQEDIYYALVRLRGDGYDPLAGVPPINTVTLEDYRARLQAEADARKAAAEDDPPEEEPDPDARKPVVPWDFALQVLGLVTPTTSSGQASVDNQVANVAAFYSSATASVTVIDRGNDRDDFFETSLLLHELTHALQDRELSGAFSDGTTDSSLASRALTEGEATFYQHLANLEMLGENAEENAWHANYTNDLLGGRTHLPANKSPFYGVRWFIYPLGARFLSDAWERGGNAGVRHAYATQPRHIAQYMTPHDEEHDARLRPVLNPALSCRVEAPGPTWQRPGLDRFGALIVYAFFTGAKIPDEQAWPLAAGWGDDLIYVFFEPEEELVLVSWRIRLADEHAAQTAVAELEKARDVACNVDPRVRFSAEGRDLVLIAGNDEDVTADWDGTLVCD
jgi:hypothetical protein